MELVPAQYIDETKKLVKDISTAFLALGERLHNIHENKLWEGQYESYEELLHDFDISKGQASKLVKIYTSFVVQYGLERSKLADIGQRRLYAILPLCNDKKTAQEQIEAIAGLSSKDVEKLVQSEKAGEHDHDWITYRICAICKESHRLYDTETV